MAKKQIKPGPSFGPMPVTLLTTGVGDDAVIITMSWVGICNNVPPMVYTSMMRSRNSYPVLKETGEFVLNQCGHDLAWEADYCGDTSGRDVDKWAETGLTKEPANVVKCPAIKESPLQLECVVKDVIELPSHDMFIAEIVSVNADDSILDEEGKLDQVKADWITFLNGDYVQLKPEKLAKWGFALKEAKK